MSRKTKRKHKRKIVVFDYDGTLTGKKIKKIQDYKKRGYTVAIMSMSMKKSSKRKRVLEAGADRISVAGNKVPALKRLGKRHSKKVYVGNLPIDRKRAERADFEYRPVR